MKKLPSSIEENVLELMALLGLLLILAGVTCGSLIHWAFTFLALPGALLCVPIATAYFFLTLMVLMYHTDKEDKYR